METIIVALDFKWMNNFAHLPQSYVDTDGKDREVRIVIIPDPVWSIIPDEDGYSKLDKNFDLALLSTHNSKCEALERLRKSLVVSFHRPDKASMRMSIDDLCGAYSKYIPVRTWMMGQHLSYSERFHPSMWSGRGPGEYIIKCNHGARGIGQVMVPAKYDINAVIRHDFFQGNTAPALDKESVSEGTPKKDDGLEKFLADFPGMAFSTHGENYPGESINMLREQGFLIQEKVPDIKAEFRLLIGADKVHVFSRDFTDGEYRQACVKTRQYAEVESSGKLDFDTLVSAGTIPGDIAKEIESAVGELIGFSVDVFVTDKGWGIFEYSNQFGTEELYGTFMQDFHKGVIKHYLKKSGLMA